MLVSHLPPATVANTRLTWIDKIVIMSQRIDRIPSHECLEMLKCEGFLEFHPRDGDEERSGQMPPDPALQHTL